jgi:hypothetical protein
MRFAEIETPDGAMVVGASPEMLAELLRELEGELATLGVPTELFAPGIARDHCRSVLRPAGGPVPAEVEVWFEWHNGTVGDLSAPRLLRPVELWSAEQVARWIASPPFPFGKGRFDMWDPSWFQLTGDNNGLIVTCDERPHPLVRRWNPEMHTDPLLQPSPLQVVSLCTPVSRWLRAIRDKKWLWNASMMQWEYDQDNPPSFFE